MLKRRIIPCLDVHGGRVVKGVQFVNLVDAGDPVEIASWYEHQGADELVFLDITASSDQRNIMLDVVRRTADQVFMPLTIGGGVRSVKDIRLLLNAGADKVSINTAAILNPYLLTEVSARFGNQCIVVAIDAKWSEADNDWVVYTHGGRTPSKWTALAWASRAIELGAGEILLTSMDCDGTKDGFDIALTKQITANVRVPVIASGGAGKTQHFSDVFKLANADAALAASVFHFKELTIQAVKQDLKNNQIPVR